MTSGMAHGGTWTVGGPYHPRPPPGGIKKPMEKKKKKKKKKNQHGSWVGYPLEADGSAVGGPIRLLRR